MNGDFFIEDVLKNPDNNSLIRRKLKKCFKYVQSELKKQYKLYRRIK